MSVSYLGYDAKYITMEKRPDDTMRVGCFVCLDSDGYYVKKCLDGASFIGLAKCIRGNYVTVQVGGYCEVKYSGLKDPTTGHIKLNSGTEGTVVYDGSDMPNQYRTVLKLDTKNKIIGFIM